MTKKDDEKVTVIEGEEGLQRLEKLADEVEDREGARGFAVVLQQLDDGCFHAEVSEALRKLNRELSDMANSHGGKVKGTMTLALTLTAQDDGTISIDCDVKTKSPKPRRPRSLFWLTKGDNLTLDNPRQQKLPLRDVGGAGRARDVGGRRAARGA